MVAARSKCSSKSRGLTKDFGFSWVKCTVTGGFWARWGMIWINFIRTICVVVLRIDYRKARKELRNGCRGCCNILGMTIVEPIRVTVAQIVERDQMLDIFWRSSQQDFLIGSIWTIRKREKSGLCFGQLESVAILWHGEAVNGTCRGIGTWSI